MDEVKEDMQVGRDRLEQLKEEENYKCNSFCAFSFFYNIKNSLKNE